MRIEHGRDIGQVGPSHSGASVTGRDGFPCVLRTPVGPGPSRVGFALGASLGALVLLGSALSACGGGSSSSATPPPAPSPTGPPAPPPTGPTAGSPPTGGDRVVSAKTAPPAVEVAIVDGQETSWVNDRTVTFSGTGVLGDFHPPAPLGTPSPPGASAPKPTIALFSREQRLLYREQDWAGDVEVLYDQPAPLVIPVVLWTAVQSGQASAARFAAEAQITTANTLLAENRAGIRLELGDPTIAGTAVVADLPSTVIHPQETGCADPGQALGVALASIDRSPALHIVYVQGVTLVEPSSDPSTTNGILGFACRFDAAVLGNSSILYVSWGFPGYRTLVHEVAHALGLHTYFRGHTNAVAGFATENIMWDFGDPAAPGSRSHLSLGQAFRMSVADGSWPNQSGLRTGETEPCGCNPYDASFCPVLRHDLAGAPPGGTFEANKCYESLIGPPIPPPTPPQDGDGREGGGEER